LKEIFDFQSLPNFLIFFLGFTAHKVYNRISYEFHCFDEENGLRGEFQYLKLPFCRAAYYERKYTTAFIAWPRCGDGGEKKIFEDSK